mmetsp:Transcript_29828/g.86504  ORF Transcript_29828/g.86504 Transcript_29828/m.86504 type:complete len:229 (+) Transcript_29828:369-1055(+)
MSAINPSIHAIRSQPRKKRSLQPPHPSSQSAAVHPPSPPPPHQTWHSSPLACRLTTESAGQSKASENSTRLDTGPSERKRPGECTAVPSRLLATFGRTISHQFCPQATQKSCSTVRSDPSSGRVCRSSSESVFRRALRASLTPPRSATFSPKVSRPFILMSSVSPGRSSGVRTTYSENWSATHVVAASNLVLLWSLHQLRSLASASYCAPWSSNPCVSSWPITPPRPP